MAALTHRLLPPLYHCLHLLDDAPAGSGVSTTTLPGVAGTVSRHCLLFQLFQKLSPLTLELNQVPGANKWTVKKGPGVEAAMELH